MSCSFIAQITYGVALAMGKIVAVMLLLGTPVSAKDVTVLALGDSLGR
ncbi:MAG: hypothetical protein AAF679_13285 [Pseudomonadota bacterium]